MAQPQWIQGSWEELSAQAEEFKDRPDLILIIPGEPNVKNSRFKEGMNLAEALQGYTGMVSFGEANLSENTGKKFADLLVEKHQKEQAQTTNDNSYPTLQSDAERVARIKSLRGKYADLGVSVEDLNNERAADSTQEELLPETCAETSENADHSNRPSALGKYAFVAGGSEAFAREKQAEVERFGHMETLTALREGLVSAEHGELKDAAQVYAEMKAKYNTRG